MDYALERRKERRIRTESFAVNKAADSEYRHCVHGKKGNCQYLSFNEYHVETCSIDSIVQVRYFGCTPSKIKDTE